jgi:beta-glucosidase
LADIACRFGLSYTTFSFSDLSISETSTNDESLTFEIAVTVRNDGTVAGSDVVQIYVAYPKTGPTTPRLQLKGYAKAHDLAPGALQKVSVKLDKYALSFWDTERSSWHATAGQYIIYVGSSSEDLPLQQTFTLENHFFWSGL